MNVAVVGAGYGDEGKGLLVDALCRRYKIEYGARYSGGSQAGHTVVTPEGKRREFHGVCAGTYAGAKTVFLKDFIINPYKLSEEIRELESEGLKVEIYVDSSCRITTIYDMVINAIAETLRGNDRHGSCGMGINETIVRNRYGNDSSAEFDVSTVFIDPWFQEGFALEELRRIKEKWVPYRLNSLGIETSQVPEPYFSILNEDPSKHAVVFEELMRFVASHCKDYLTWWDLGHASASTVFESSQGLLLDQRYGFFPHCTPGLVGCKDIPSYVRYVPNCVYVTRAYASRHGAGPLPYEGEWMSFEDHTNVDNEWQGFIRYAPLDVDRMRVAIACDSLGIRSRYLAVTHLDQIINPLIDEVVVYHHCKPKSIPVDKFSDWLCDALGLDGVLCESHGPCSEDIAWRDIELHGLTRRAEKSCV